MADLVELARQPHPESSLRQYRCCGTRSRSRYGVVAPLHREIASASRTMPTLHSERDAFYLAAPARPSRRLIGRGFWFGRHSIICSSGGPDLSSGSNPRPKGNRHPQRNGRERLRSRSTAVDQGSRRRATTLAMQPTTACFKGGKRTRRRAAVVVRLSPGHRGVPTLNARNPLPCGN